MFTDVGDAAALFWKFVLDFIPLKTHALCSRAKFGVGDITGLGVTSLSMTLGAEGGVQRLLKAHITKPHVHFWTNELSGLQQFPF